VELWVFLTNSKHLLCALYKRSKLEIKPRFPTTLLIRSQKPARRTGTKRKKRISLNILRYILKNRQHGPFTPQTSKVCAPVGRCGQSRCCRKLAFGNMDSLLCTPLEKLRRDDHVQEANGDGQNELVCFRQR